MKLNFGERMAVLQILPPQGNFVTLKIVRDLQSVLSPSEEEHKKFEIKHIGPQFTWNDKGLEEKEIDIGEKAIDIIVEALKQLDKDKKLTNSHLSIYEKFIK